MNIVPFFHAQKESIDDGPSDGAVDKVSESDLVIFSLEIRNTYGLTFDATFECTQPGKRYDIALDYLILRLGYSSSSTVIIPPGSTTRYAPPLV